MRDRQPARTIRRSDYQPPAYTLSDVVLDFDLEAESTTVQARLQLQRASGVDGNEPLRLDGVDLELVHIALDGEPLAPDRYSVDEKGLTIQSLPASFALETTVRIHPDRNTALEGLYESGDFLLTQCEAEGFRKITYYPDRPDVMGTFTVTLRADSDRYPVLLSNGNRTGSGKLENGRHWARWEDPFPKPSYLFALVAGDLEVLQSRFTTASGRGVTLNIYSEAENISQCDYAMTSLKNAMRWDEQRFGLEYDLDVYNLVVTNDFNMGAMENKSLNIFNAQYVLATSETATDADYQGIESVIGHEYFHNWTGNRVTCRDWFQLTLKEGLTVYRDQEFSSDMQSRAVQRISDVDRLRRLQFPQDAGPQKHPVRPEEYIEINNFYTTTVYEKGAEVVRLYATLLGDEGFRRGMDLYFERHDGQAVTCDDFRSAMADANERDLTQVEQWYLQAGTPQVEVRQNYDAERGRCQFRIRQSNPAQPDGPPLMIPIRMSLLDAEGELISFAVDEQADKQEEVLLVLDRSSASFEVSGLESEPVPSLLRGFSAPVQVDYPYSQSDLRHLLAYDTDPVSRWDASHRLYTRTILDLASAHRDDQPMQLDEGLVVAVARLLDDQSLNPAAAARMLELPAETELAEAESPVNVTGLHKARKFNYQALGEALQSQFQARYQSLSGERGYRPEASEIARRSLRNVCLTWLMASGNVQLAAEQYQSADNMTDRLAALRTLLMFGAPEADQALADFEARFRQYPLVMNKWFALQALQPRENLVDDLDGLLRHPAFSLKNPNKVRAVVGTFSQVNHFAFHANTGRGYQFVADRILELDDLNPQVAARLASAFNRWRRYDEQRQGQMQDQMQRILDKDNLSPGVYEIIANALQGEV